MLDPYRHDRAALQQEVDSFQQLMRPATALAEKRDILPFFRQNRHLAAYLGYANNYLASPDILSFERSLLEGFQCDIAIGDSHGRQFTLVELEDASNQSVFRATRNRRTYPCWSRRFEAGFSQLVDWAWRLDLERPPSVTLRPIFGTANPIINYLLVIGRDHWLDDTAAARLEWRRRHNGIHGQRTTIWTYDYFLRFVLTRIAEANA